ncbi:hypothetical protein HYALB_00005613 [Hymenoscyphus albidus]|uniref:Dynamin N-terminal domain-containing protein n=1 Tax=Hymenoscyphus albidus TaxID=595503 RepID=A0A9N9LHH5_9HELO|nr:hypothetical protein HYALB_00005613 [Hymenoscyphus albidus]
MADSKAGVMEALIMAHEATVKSEPENDNILRTMDVPKFIRPPKIKGEPSPDPVWSPFSLLSKALLMREKEEFEDSSVTDKLKTAKYTRSTLDSLRNFLEDKTDLYPECDQFLKEAVEVSYNRSQIPSQQYTVEIDFDNNEEFIEQAVIWQDDINNRMDGEQLDSSKSNSDAAIAFSKLKAVFPGASTGDLSDVLGKTKIIHKSKAKDMHNVIKSYVDSNNKSSEGSLWPLVKVVRLYTKSSILQSGLVLVDVPGVGDSNTARSAIALRYMNNLDYIFIVADIVRVVDEQIAKDLLSRLFRDRLYIDNKYNTIAFVLTKTDIINTEEVIESLYLEDSSMKLETKQIRKLEKALEVKIESIKHSQSVLKLQMKTKCIEERNNWSSERLELDFRQGIIETWLEMAELEGEKTPRKEYAEYRSSKLNVFCVSSTAFYNLKGKMYLEYDKVGFGSPEATNIPALQRFAIELASDENEKLVDHFITR